MADAFAVELCGRLADPCGRHVTVDLPPSGLSVRDLMALLGEAHPALNATFAAGRIKACVNDEVVSDDAVVVSADQVALFPPVSGG
jgi:sulfur-carrier protein